MKKSQRPVSDLCPVCYSAKKTSRHQRLNARESIVEHEYMCGTKIVVEEPSGEFEAFHSCAMGQKKIH
jgi:hypothetical protein